MTGKWCQAGIPHKGWTCVSVEDLETPAYICEMCEVQEIRYVHTMCHPDYPETLDVGCVCASHMEADYNAPERRERALKNEASRRQRWLNRKWRRSRKGNPFLNTDGFNIVIFRSDNQLWGSRILDRSTDDSVVLKPRHIEEDAAKLAAFNTMVFLKQKKTHVLDF